MVGRGFAVAGLFAVACGCEVRSPRADASKRDLAPAVLVVRQSLAQKTPVVDGPRIFAAPERQSDGSEARPFTSLREALSFAPAGAMLRIDEGIWREAIEITRPVVLMGRGPDRTRIAPPPGTRSAVYVHGVDHVQLYGLSIEGAQRGVEILGGAGHRLENVELRDFSEVALTAQNANLAIISTRVRDVAEGRTGHGIELTSGSLEAKRLVMINAGRRAILLHGTHARLEDLEVTGSQMGAVQAVDGADVRVLRGEFEGQGGASLYAGASKLSVESAHLRNDEYAIIGARGAELSVSGVDVSDYRVAGVALVNSHGTVQRTSIARGGTEGGISINRADGKEPVLLLDNRIRDPGTMGVHVTQSSVTARGNSITGARLDHDKDLGDAFFAIDSKLIIEDNVLRGNAGSGVAIIRSSLELDGNGLIGNGRAGLLLLDRSRGSAAGNFFQSNGRAAVEVGEQARAELARNHFEGNPQLDIDTGCGKGVAGFAELLAGNTFVTPVRKRACAE